MRCLLVGFIVFFLSCATTKNALEDASVSYLDTAKENFTAGEKALSDGHSEDALAFFRHVKSKYPYSQYAALSDLKIADTYFIDEKWIEAADAYEYFIRFHPRHEQLEYAYFRIAKSYFNAMPRNFFILPKSYVRDLTPTNEALAAVNKYLEYFPKGANAADAVKLKSALRKHLAEREMHVATFYIERKKWPAAIARYERMADLYPEIEFADKALCEAATIAHEQLNDDDIALNLLNKLQQTYPKSLQCVQLLKRAQTWQKH